MDTDINKKAKKDSKTTTNAGEDIANIVVEIVDAAIDVAGTVGEGTVEVACTVGECVGEILSGL